MDASSLYQAALGRIQAYCTEHDLSEGTFGRLVMDDYRFVERVRQGVATVASLVKADQVMAAPPSVRSRSKAAAQAAAA